jgi:hypothetical protein
MESVSFPLIYIVSLILLFHRHLGQEGVQEYVDRVYLDYPSIKPEKIWDEFCDLMQGNNFFVPEEAQPTDDRFSPADAQEECGIPIQPDEEGGEDEDVIDGNFLLRRGKTTQKKGEKALPEMSEVNLIELAEMVQPFKKHFVKRSFAVCIPAATEIEYPLLLLELLEVASEPCEYGTEENKSMNSKEPWHLEVSHFLPVVEAWEKGNFLDCAWQAIGIASKEVPVVSAANSMKTKKKKTAPKKKTVKNKMRIDWNKFQSSCVLWGVVLEEDLTAPTANNSKKGSSKHDFLKKKVRFPQLAIDVFKTHPLFPVYTEHAKWVTDTYQFSRNNREEQPPSQCPQPQISSEIVLAAGSDFLQRVHARHMKKRQLRSRYVIVNNY